MQRSTPRKAWAYSAGCTPIPGASKKRHKKFWGLTPVLPTPVNNPPIATPAASSAVPAAASVP
eukprot:5824740-Amphidinium_carterae.1